jgi:hypothetical protein
MRRAGSARTIGGQEFRWISSAGTGRVAPAWGIRPTTSSTGDRAGEVRIAGHHQQARAATHGQQAVR